jgi:hypothetical protein
VIRPEAEKARTGALALTPAPDRDPPQGESRQVHGSVLRRIFAFAALVAVLVGLAGLTLQIVRTLGTPPEALERKLTGAKKSLYYRVTASEGPELRLTGTERDLHFIAHAILPGAPPYDPTRQLVYGLRLTLSSDEREVWRRDIYTRSRQSKGAPAAGLWQEENAFTLEPGVQVTDDRLIAVHLPDGLVRPGLRLDVRLVGDAEEGLLRLYERVERPPARVELRLRSLAPVQREELAEQLSFTPWDRLDAAERNARLRLQGLRRSADGREGEDYATRTLYTTNFRVPIDEQAPLAGTLVTPARAAAINVVGPVDVTLSVTRAPAVAPSVVPATLLVRSLGEGGQPAPWIVPVPPAPAAQTRILTVPAGLHSLHLTTDARDGVQVLLNTPPGARAQLGPARPGAGLDEPLLPEEQLLPGYVIGPDTPPVELDLAGPDDLLGRTVRVDARLLPPPTPPGTLARGRLEVELVGDGGRGSRQTVELESLVAPFEEVRLRKAETRIVAEPTGFRMVAPLGTRKILVRAAQQTHVRLYTLVTLSPSPDALEPPFDQVQLKIMMWRYAPFDERSWVSRLADNHLALAPLVGKLAAQVRLEPAPPPVPPVGALAQTLLPEGAPEKQVIIEHVRPEEMVAFQWTDGYYTQVRPGRPQKLKVAGPAPPKLQVWVLGGAEENLGHELHVAVDGEPLASFVLSSTRAAFTMPYVAPGVHTFVVSTDAPNLRLLLDQQPAGGGDILALRNLYRVTGRLAVSVRKPAGPAPLTLDLIVYTTGPEPDPKALYKVTIDGGVPRHAEGVALARFSPGLRTEPLPAADREPILGFADTADRTVLYPRLIAVGLGDDLAPGVHTITVEPLRGQRAATWMRFFIMTTARPDTEKAIQWRLAAPSGEGRAD